MPSPRESLIAILDQYKIAHQKLLVAVSGGGDSVSLLLLLHKVQQQYKLQLSVAHFDHQLRVSSGEDAKWVNSLCEQLGVPCFIGTPDKSLDSTQQGGIEESARKQRYQFLQRVAESQKASWIAVAHTADDQAETVLHHIARGTGLKGLQGIPEARVLSETVSLIRPLLQVSRSDLVTDLAKRKQAFLRDETNTDSKFTRNKIRHEVLPYLKETLNPQIDQALRRLAQQAQEAQFAIDKMASTLLDRAVADPEDLNMDRHVVRIALIELKQHPEAVVSAMFLELWIRKRWSRKKMSHFHWSQLTSIAKIKSAVGLSLPDGVQATLRRDVLELRLDNERSF